MKVTKKLFAFLMALVMVMGLGLTASAATITITNAKPGETYEAYKLFDVTVSGDAYSYSTTDVTLKTLLEEIGLTFTTSADGNTYYVKSTGAGDTGAFETASGSMSAAELAVELKGKVDRLGEPDAKRTVGEDESNVVFSGLSEGYYFVTSTMGSLCFLQTNNTEVTIEEKNEEPKIEKEGVETASVGQKVTYTVTITAQKGATNYKLHDTMTESLTFNNDVTVTLNDEAVADENYIVTTGDQNEDGCTVEVAFNQAFCDTLEDDDQLVVSYSATVNEKAITIDPNNNAHLNYGNNSSTTSDSVTTKNYAFDIVKDDKEDNLLNDAEFKLYIKTEEDEYTAQKFVKTKNGYRVAMADENGATETIQVNGKVTIDGLASGTYYLEETKAPDGYNKLENMVPVTLGEVDNLAIVEDGVYVSGGVEVENVAGSLLPSTGGMGTTVIYIIGAVLVIGAGIILVVRRRRNA